MRLVPGLRLLTALACTAVSACSAGTGSETVFRTLTEEDGNRASFDIEMSDSTGSYTMSLITRIQKGGGTPAVLTMGITLTSPSRSLRYGNGIFPLGLPGNQAVHQGASGG